MPEGASYASADSYALKAGINTVRLKVKAQSGYTTDYVIDVNASKACTLYIDSGNGIVPGEPVKILRGDTNGDGFVNGRDLADIKMHILGVKLIPESDLKRVSTDGDEVVNGRELADVKMHILGIKLLT